MKSKTQYIALLRGINVGGRNKLPMAELRKLCNGLGWHNVSTYIQSGNVLFTLDNETSTPDQLEQTLAKKIKESYGYDVPVLIIKAAVLASIIEDHPFKTKGEPKTIHYTLFSKKPNGSVQKWAASLTADKDNRISGGDHAVYLYCPNGYSKTKWGNAWIERQLGVPTTTRNLKTLSSLLNKLDT